MRRSVGASNGDRLRYCSTRSVLCVMLKCTKFIFSRGSAQESPAGGRVPPIWPRGNVDRRHRGMDHNIVYRLAHADTCSAVNSYNITCFQRQVGAATTSPVVYEHRSF